MRFVQGQRRLGGSALAQAYSQLGSDCPDVDMLTVQGAFETTQTLLKSGRIVSGHDISDGGAVVTVLEMAFAGVAGVQVLACRFHTDDALGLVQIFVGSRPWRFVTYRVVRCAEGLNALKVHLLHCLIRYATVKQKQGFAPGWDNTGGGACKMALTITSAPE